MTLEELTPEAVALMTKLVNNPQPVEDSALLRLLMADRVVMGSPNKVCMTRSGGRLLAAYRAAQMSQD